MFNKFLKSTYQLTPIIHNQVVLYFLVFVFLVDLLYFLNSKDMYSFSTLILISLLLSFFNKNMIVILFISIVFTNILKYGQQTSFSEGMESNGKDEEKEKEKEKEKGKSKGDEDDSEKNISKLKDFTKKIDTLVKSKDDPAGAELIENLQDMRETRDKIVDSVKNMQPLLTKFQGYVEKFNEYKKSANNNALNSEPL